jgi:hypothetical protein
MHAGIHLPENAAPSPPDAAAGRLPLFNVVGFTGHRELADVAGAALAIREALAFLVRELPGEWIALSSIARGGDQLFVAEARAAGMSWHGILPLARAEFERDFAPAEWAAVEATLETADHLRVIHEYGDREDSYLDCGIETVNGCDILLAYWDGNDARGKGGTGQVVQYAKSIGKPVLIIDPATRAMRRENWDKLQVGDAILQDLNSLPEAPFTGGENPFSAPDSVLRFQHKCDWHASQGAPHFRRLIVATVMSHVMATLIATATVAYALHMLVLPWAKLVFVTFGLVAALALRRHLRSHHSWVRCRLAAEFCRSALATWGLPRAAPLLQDLDLVGARRLTRALYVLHTRSSVTRSLPIEEFKPIYLAKRIDDQIAYFNRQVNKALPVYRRLMAGFWIATLLAVACIASYAVTRTAGIAVPLWVEETAFVFLQISLPVVAASLISIISINDLQRRVARYQEMRALLSANRAEVAACLTWNSLEHIVLKTERVLLQEVIEWHSLRSFAESP